SAYQGAPVQTRGAQWGALRAGVFPLRDRAHLSLRATWWKRGCWSEAAYPGVPVRERGDRLRALRDVASPPRRFGLAERRRWPVGPSNVPYPDAPAQVLECAPKASPAAVSPPLYTALAAPRLRSAGTSMSAWSDRPGPESSLGVRRPVLEGTPLEDT